MSEQGELFYETLTDALRATVDALGGPKVVGVMLWPEMGLDEARRRLLDCLNPDRQHRLDPDRLLRLMKLSREKGVHIAIAWILAELGYATPQPIEPEDQQAELIRQFNRAAETVSAMGERILRLGVQGIEARTLRR